MKESRHIEGWLENDYDGGVRIKGKYETLAETLFPEVGGFEFGEESTEVINNVFLRFYSADHECTLEEAEQGHIEQLSGRVIVSGELYGYSEYTIEGTNISEFTIGGHDLGEIFKNHVEKYVHILIDIGR